jgi:hypothetical protein
MRMLGDTGLLRVEIGEWPEVRDRLLSLGYRFVRHETGQSRTLWTPDLARCVSNYVLDHGDRYYVLDSCVVALVKETR